jgi:hypothetical protein
MPYTEGAKDTRPALQNRGAVALDRTCRYAHPTRILSARKPPLATVAAEAPGLVPWAWGINGFFTVIGTILALMFAMIFGFITVLVMAGVCYLLAWLALTWTRGARKTPG